MALFTAPYQVPLPPPQSNIDQTHSPRVSFFISSWFCDMIFDTVELVIGLVDLSAILFRGGCSNCLNIFRHQNNRNRVIRIIYYTITIILTYAITIF